MLYSVLFRFGHIRRWDQCAVYILYSKISTDPGLLKIRHSHRFVAVVIQFLIPLDAIITAIKYKSTLFEINTFPGGSKIHCQIRKSHVKTVANAFLMSDVHMHYYQVPGARSLGNGLLQVLNELRLKKHPNCAFFYVM